MRSPCMSSSRRLKNSGVVLIVVMVMLVIIGFMSVAVMRGAMNSDQISNNNRAQIQASEAAQLALRFCEAEILRTSTFITIAASPVTAAKPSAPPVWKSKDVWTSTTPGSAVEIPADALKISGMPDILKRPQCLAEYASATPPSPIVLTARGFSADYSEDSNTKKITSGSVVWLQSTFVLSPKKP
jgi:type IV pilus assembly protein PilX